MYCSTAFEVYEMCVVLVALHRRYSILYSIQTTLDTYTIFLQGQVRRPVDYPPGSTTWHKAPKGPDDSRRLVRFEGIKVQLAYHIPNIVLNNLMHHTVIAKASVLYHMISESINLLD